MSFQARVQAAVAAIRGKTTAVIDSAEHQALLNQITGLTGDLQTAINERDTAIAERDTALAALEGLAGTSSAEEVAEEAADDEMAEEADSEAEEVPAEDPPDEMAAE